MENKIETFLKVIEDKLDFEILAYIKIDELPDNDVFTYITTQLEDNEAFYISFSGSAHAMEYLSNNDASLTRSLSIASDMRYSVDKINSELLASILGPEINLDNWYRYEKKITNFFNELNEPD
jgi:hypothetical protein